jgi:LmbE family N-acetylglucosaminyl deacetylase
MSNPTPEQLKEIRKKELANATKILGVPSTNVWCLDFEDGSLEQHKNEFERMVIKILSDSPQEIYFPYKRDFNKDHQIANQIIQNCVINLRLPTLTRQYPTFSKFLHLDHHI